MTNTEAAKILERLSVDLRWNISGKTLAALGKAITALEHQPEPQTEVYPDAASVVGGKSPITIYEAFLKDSPGLECNVCHWRTLDTTRTLCDSCGSFELAPVSDIGQVKP
jgi:hypothetical protein